MPRLVVRLGRLAAALAYGLLAGGCAGPTVPPPRHMSGACRGARENRQSGVQIDKPFMKARG